MMWSEILMAVVSALLGGGLVSLLTIRGQRKKVNAEADNTAISGLHETIGMLQEENRRLKEDNEKAEKTEDELRQHMNDLRDECTTKGFYMCVHMGCPMRKPVQGRGKEWFKAHSKEDNYGGDYTQIRELLEAHGYTVTKDDSGAIG